MFTYREIPEVRLYANDAEWDGIDLSKTALPAPALDRAELARCKFNCSRIIGGSYCGMRCERVTATSARIIDCYIQRARFVRVDFTKSYIRETVFKDCVFTATIFTRAVLENTRFINCAFVGCFFFDAKGCDTETFSESCSFNTCSGIPDIPMVCPETGSFVAYKKVRGFGHDEYGDEITGLAIAKLYIPSEARRSSGLGRKCRCEFAMVLSIRWVQDSTVPIECARSDYVGALCAVTYREGETAYADSWNEDRWKECSHGIHFFMTEREALAY